MATAVYKTKLSNGVLPLPDAAREELHLRDGDEVKVVVTTFDASIELDREENPLLKIIGIGKKGGRSDGGVNHDKYLYGSDPL